MNQVTPAPPSARSTIAPAMPGTLDACERNPANAPTSVPTAWAANR